MSTSLRAVTSALLMAVAACARPTLPQAAATTQTEMLPEQPPEWDSSIIKRDASWFASAEARAVADSVLQYQSAEGGWPKNTNLSVPPRSSADMPAANMSNTIDNNGTTLPMHFLARVIRATGDPRYTQAFNRGLDYLLAAQYPNGGWPQFYPPRRGYWSRITFNDDAMVRVLRLLRDSASGREPFAFVDPQRRAAASRAVARGTDLILRLQVIQKGGRTAWAAQYDEHTLRPAGARSFEPASLSGNESVGIVRYLMSIENPSPEVVAAVEAAVRWFQLVKIEGMRLEEFTNATGERDKRLVLDPTAEPLWARLVLSD